MQLYTLFDRLEEDGQTTLGPALLISVQLASQAPGSKVAILQDYVINTVSGGGGRGLLHVVLLYTFVHLHRSLCALMDWQTEVLETWMVSSKNLLA